MAGVKITDLTPITSAASNDLLYIVDVSNTTQSPEGTSSQIEVGNMFSSGTFECTPSGEVNDIEVLPTAGNYIRVGNIVICSIQMSINLAPLENTGTFELSLPIASNFTNTKQLFGLMQWSWNGTLAEIVTLSIGADVTNNTCKVSIGTATDEILMAYCVIQFQYEIVE
jgi:hypothetical protein